MVATCLLHGSLHNDPDAGWEVGESLLQQTVVCDTIFFKAIEEGCWCVLQLRLLNDNHTLKVGVHTGGLCMSTNGNVSIVTCALPRNINPAEALVEEVIEAFMNIICLGHHHCVAFDGRVTNGCNCINLGREQLIDKVCESPLKLPCLTVHIIVMHVPVADLGF